MRRVARWHECDPAGVVFAGNFSEFLLSAASLFRRHVFGRDWRLVRDELGVDVPGKATALIYHGSLWPDDAFDITVWAGAVRTRTFDILARATRVDDGAPVFDGRHASICVDAADRRRSLALPPALSGRLAASRDRSPPPPDLLEMRW